jgi:hypothetical protein
MRKDSENFQYSPNIANKNNNIVRSRHNKLNKEASNYQSNKKIVPSNCKTDTCRSSRNQEINKNKKF